MGYCFQIEGISPRQTRKKTENETPRLETPARTNRVEPSDPSRSAMGPLLQLRGRHGGNRRTPRQNQNIRPMDKRMNQTTHASGFSYRGSMKILDHENLYEQNQIRSRYNHPRNRQTLVDDIQQTQPETQQTQSKQIHPRHSIWSLDA